MADVIAVMKGLNVMISKAIMHVWYKMTSIVENGLNWVELYQIRGNWTERG